MNDLRNLLARCLAAGALLAISNPAAAQNELQFGVYATDKPSTVAKMFAPVTDALSRSLTQIKGKPTEVKLRVFMTYDEALEALVKGQVDFARFGPASYVLAKAQNPEVELLAMESKGGKTTFTGMIVVRTDSPFKTLEDLRGQSFAFGDQNSTVGRFIAQQNLLRQGIPGARLSRYSYLGRHDKVFRAVQLRQFAAGSLKDSTFKKLNSLGQLRVLEQFEVPTKPWVARSGMSEQDLAHLRTALLGIKDEAALAGLKVSGFLATDDSFYRTVRASMLATIKFEDARDSDGQARPGTPSK